MPFYRCAMPSSSGGGGGGEAPSGGMLISISNDNLTIQQRQNTVHRQINMPITISDQTKNASYVFYMCNLLNSPVIIGNNVEHLDYAFFQCTNYNQPLNLPSSLKTMNNTFQSFSKFNYPITIPDGVESMVGSFLAATNFNQPMTIPGSVIYANYAFNACYNFNQEITINNGSKVLSGILQFCNKFNRPINIPASVNSLSYAFANCDIMNSRINLPYSVSEKIDMAFTFSSMRFLNSPQILTEPSFLRGTFFRSINFNSPVLIRGNYDNFNFTTNSYFTYDMFNFSHNFRSNLIFDISVNNAIMGNRSFYSCIRLNSARNYQSPVRIYAPDSMINVISASDSLFFGTAITWTPATNGYFNSTYNFYLLNNISDAKNSFNEYWNTVYGEYPDYE